VAVGGRRRDWHSRAKWPVAFKVCQVFDRTDRGLKGGAGRRPVLYGFALLAQKRSNV